MAKETGRKLVASNRKARHDYTIEDVFEAGIVLSGTEVKSLRAGRASLVDGFVSFYERRGVARGRAHPRVRRRHLDQPPAAPAAQAAAAPRRDHPARAGRQPERPDRRPAVSCTSWTAGPRSRSRSPAARRTTTSGRRCASGRTTARPTARCPGASRSEAACADGGSLGWPSLVGRRGRRSGLGDGGPGLRRRHGESIPQLPVADHRGADGDAARQGDHPVPVRRLRPPRHRPHLVTAQRHRRPATRSGSTRSPTSRSAARPARRTDADGHDVRRPAADPRSATRTTTRHRHPDLRHRVHGQGRLQPVHRAADRGRRHRDAAARRALLEHHRRPSGRCRSQRRRRRSPRPQAATAARASAACAARPTPAAATAGATSRSATDRRCSPGRG